MVFKPGERPPNSGRRRGTPNITTQILKDAILLAGEQIGELTPRRKTPRRRGEDDGLTDVEYEITQRWDWDGYDGLVGYLRWAAVYYPKSYIALLARVLPLQIKFDGKPAARRYLTPEEIHREIKARGLPVPRQIEHRPIVPQREQQPDYEDAVLVSETPPPRPKVRPRS
jgi:hypothetical protein